MSIKSEATLGYVGPKFMEEIQVGNHFFKGRWLSYTAPKSNRMGRQPQGCPANQTAH
jgi:hypothetical protein